MSADRAAWRRVAAEVAHPFRDGRSVLWDLLAGSRVLAGRLRGWVTAPESFKAMVERAGGVAAGVFVTGWIIHRYPTMAVPSVLAGWCVAAWALSPPRPVKPVATRNNHEKDVAGESDPDHPNIGHWIIRAVHDATQNGRRGIHIADLLDQLHRAGLSDTWDIGTLRTWCEEAGYPVRRGLQIRGVGNTYGIHVADLTEALGMPLADVLAGLGDTPAPPAPNAPPGPPDPAPLEAPVAPSPTAAR